MGAFLLGEGRRFGWSMCPACGTLILMDATQAFDIGSVTERQSEVMDPNAAFESILHGHMVADHVEALEGWLLGGGFEPAEVLMPVDKHPFFAAHCERTHGDAAGHGIRVKANSTGIWTFNVGADDWYLVARWSWLAKLEDC